MKKLFSLFTAVVLTGQLAFSVAGATLLPKAAAGGLQALSPGARVISKTELSRNGAVSPVKTPFNTPSGAIAHPAKSAPVLRKAPEASEGTSIPRLYGYVYYSSTWDTFSEPGVFYLPRNDSEDYELIISGMNALNGGVVKDGVYYSCHTLSYGTMILAYYYAHSLETGQEVGYYYGTPYTISMTLDDTTGTIYAIACGGTSDGPYLAKIDFGKDILGKDELTVTPIGDLPGQWNSIAADKDGQLYGIRYYTKPNGTDEDCTLSELYRIDKKTAEITLVGETGMYPKFRSDATIDHNSGRMFWIVSPADDSGIIAEVNLETGEATPLYYFPDNAAVTGLCIDAPEALDKAPAAVTDMSVAFEGGSMEGTVSFTAPTTLFDGTPAEGSITATVMANGEKIATRSVQFGQKATVAVTLPAAGLYTFDVVVANATGTSPKVSAEPVFVGNGTPKAPAPQLVYADGKMQLTWEPVTVSADGGYLDPAEVTYTVRRFPDGVTVAESISATSFTEPLEPTSVLTSYYYTVTAEFKGMKSSEAESNPVLLGALTPPYTADFNNGFDDFTVINSDPATFTWTNQESWVSGIIGHGNYIRINTYGTTPSDDWLISPPIQLEGGRAYDLTFFVVTSTQNDEILEVKMGRGNAVEDLTTSVLEPTVMRYGQGGEITCSLHIVETGAYTFGFHCISEAQSFYIALDDISVSEPYSLEIPNPVTDLTVTPVPQGVLQATVSLKAPSQTINGTPLAAIEKIVVSRGDTPVHTFDNPTPGATLEFVDEVEAEGTYAYTAVVSNSEGVSLSSTASAYVGTGIAMATANVRFVRNATPGEVTVTWDPVTENVHGVTIDPASVKYDLYTANEYHSYELVKGLTDTQYTYQAVPEGEQAFMQYLVIPVTPAGEGRGTVSEMKPVGTPYAGIHESGSLDCVWNASGTGAMWVPGFTEDVGVEAQDGDDRFFALSGTYLEDGGMLSSGLIDLTGITSPGLTFYLYSMGEEDTNEFKVYVTDIADGERAQVADLVMNTLTDSHAWNKVMIPLYEYEGKTVIIAFEGKLMAYTLILLDNITVGRLLDYDLAVESIVAPPYATAGTSFDVTVTLRNEGMKAADGFTVELLSGQTVLDTQSGTPIASNTRGAYTFVVDMDATADGVMPLQAVAVYAADQDISNNVSDPIGVLPELSHLPVPLNLTASSHDGAVVLDWTEPDYARGAAMPVTEDFETAESWSHSYGEWQFVDVDNSPVGCIVGFTTPGMDYSITTSSFYIFDTDEKGADETFAAHSGSKFMASLFRWDNKQVDDWAVSPRLDGSAQTIHFFARSYDPFYPETIEVYYTTSDSEEFNAADYTQAKRFERLTGYYKEYNVELPDGAVRFAIRNCGKAAYLLLVDDVTFVPDSPRIDVDLKGYDIYRDNVKLNSEPVTGTSFTDPDVTLGQNYEYFVIARYDKGTSSPSETASIVHSGMSVVSAGGVAVTTEGNSIIVSGAAGEAVTIHAVDGMTVYSGLAPERLDVEVSQGVYLVTVPGKVVKVIVR